MRHDECFAISIPDCPQTLIQAAGDDAKPAKIIEQFKGNDTERRYALE